MKMPHSGKMNTGVGKTESRQDDVDRGDIVAASARDLPAELHTVLWDVDLQRTDTRQHQDFIIERVLEYGNAASIRWLSEHYDPPSIAQVVRTSRRLSPRTVALWTTHFNLQPREVRAWQDPSPSLEMS